MKIVVLAGGLSPERNVSLSSGILVAEALRGRGHQVALVDLFFGLENWTNPPEALYSAPVPVSWKKIDRAAPDLAQVKASRKDKNPNQFGPGVLTLCANADAVFLALHGRCGEDGRVQAAFDLMGIPYTGAGYLGSALAMDKDLTKKLVVPHGVRTPKWQVLTYTAAEMDALAASLDLPLVIKPMDSGSSIGVAIAHNREQLCSALRDGLKFGGRVIAEQYIQGRELQTGVLGNRALPSIEIIPKQGFYDYENKYQPDAAQEVCPAQIPQEIERELQATALKVHQLLDLSVYSRADFIVDDKGQVWFLEINTLPGMTPTSLLPQEAAAVDMSYPELCECILATSLEARKKGL